MKHLMCLEEMRHAFTIAAGKPEERKVEAVVDGKTTLKWIQA
jgi:hypothetical protein